HVDAVHLGHVPVGQHEVGPLVAGGRERLGAVRGLEDLPAAEAGLAQGADDDRPHHAAVVGDEDSHSSSPFVGVHRDRTRGSPRHRRCRWWVAAWVAGWGVSGVAPCTGPRPPSSTTSTTSTTGRVSRAPSGRVPLRLPPTTLATSPTASRTS